MVKEHFSASEPELQLNPCVCSLTMNFSFCRSFVYIYGKVSSCPISRSSCMNLVLYTSKRIYTFQDSAEGLLTCMGATSLLSDLYL